MSCNYAEGLSEYGNKGVLGTPEKYDSEEEITSKCCELAKLLETAKHVVVHTGAGISTNAGIPDFRGPNGVWTLEKKGIKPKMDLSFDSAVPTKTHLALKALAEKSYVHYIVSQNIDGLHLKSGLSRDLLSELHGNVFIDQCDKCRRQFVRKTASPTVGQKRNGGVCNPGQGSRPCRGGFLIDNVLDWEHDLPDRDLDMAFMHSTLADVNIVLGSTLQINPSGKLPLRNKKYNGKLVICNLQPTKHDNKADIRIYANVDVVLGKVAKLLGVEIPEYDSSQDPTKMDSNSNIEWTLSAASVKNLEKGYEKAIKAATGKGNKLEFSMIQLNDFLIKSELEGSKRKKIKSDPS